MLLHPSHACSQLWRNPAADENGFVLCLRARQMCGHHIHHITLFLLEPMMLMLHNALASVCNSIEVVGFVGSKWNAVAFYCDRVEHQQSVMAQQSATINWMWICIQSRSFTWSGYSTIYSLKKQVPSLPWTGEEMLAKTVHSIADSSLKQ